MEINPPTSSLPLGNAIPNPDVASLTDFFGTYRQQLNLGLSQVSRDAMGRACLLLEKARFSDGRVFVAGNGGSSAISEHLCCDWMKGTHSKGRPPLRVQSLTSNLALFTALANDLGYENSISQQVEMMAEPGDVIVLISSSGNSLNVVKAAETARAKEVSVVGLTGFTGGKLRDLAEISLHVPIANYGIVEDAHQILMHVISQYLSQSTNKKEFVKEMN